MLHLTRRRMLASTAGATIAIGINSQACALLPRRGLDFIAKLHLHNMDTAHHYASPNVSYGHAFRDGDIPAGGSVTMTDSRGNPVAVQMDAVSHWPSGCPRFVVLSHACSETFGPGARKTYGVGSSTTAPNNTPADGWGSSPEATIAANTDFTVQYLGFDAGTNTYTVSFNKILANFHAFPWGVHYPLGGWERTKTGPVCMEWHAWQYLINDASSKPQGYVRCDMWIKAWSPTGPFEIDVRTSQPNMWNTISPKSEMYNISPGRWATACVVRNGSKVLQYAGGPGDARKLTIPNANFDPPSCRIIAAAGSLFPQQGIVFSSRGRLPAGIKDGMLYWLGYAGQQANPYICAERVFVSAIEQNAPQAWSANTNYSLNQTCGNGNILYICVQAGTSGTAGGPTGTGNAISDGTCVWQNMTIPFSDQGNGTILAYPVNACFPSTAWITGDMLANPLWDGAGRRPPIFPGHDFDYLTSKSKFVPCYNTRAGFEFTNQPVNAYAPNRNWGGLWWYLDTSGDGAEDQRIGYIDGWGVTTLYNPRDPFYLFSQLQAALCFSNYPLSYMVDERGGMPFCANNGPNRDGKPYKHLPGVLPGWAGNNTPGKTPAFGVGNWLPWSSAYRDQNGFRGQYYVDPSHMPAPWQIAYMKTGRPCFLEQAIHMSNTCCFMGFLTQQTLGEKTYYCVINGAYWSIQERGWAWALRSLTQAVYITPEANAFQPVLRDYYEDNAAFQARYYRKYVPKAAATLGILNVLDHGINDGKGHMAPWELSFLFLPVAMEAWRGGLTSLKSGEHWVALLNYMNGFWSAFETNFPRSLYYAGAYDFVYSPQSGNLAASYQTGQDLLSATYADSVNGGMQAPYPKGGLYDQNVNGNLLINNFPENCTWYGSVMRAAMKMVMVAQPGETAVGTMMKKLIDMTAAATGQTKETAGIQWHGLNNGVVGNYHTFAIF